MRIAARSPRAALPKPVGLRMAVTHEIGECKAAATAWLFLVKFDLRVSTL